jgi:hypothetical protein
MLFVNSLWSDPTPRARSSVDHGVCPRKFEGIRDLPSRSVELDLFHRSKVQVLPRYECDVSRHRRQLDLRMQVRLLSFRGPVGGAFGCAGGLVVAVGVEDELAEELAGGGDDPDV